MANPAADPKAAPLAEDLKEFALTLPTAVFPKNFFCALCSQLAVDSYKLLCCNKHICPSCQEKLTFPTTCPSCDHSPLEADSCIPNKALRNTMRVWLQKHKKKEEAKAATQAPPTPVEPAPVASEVQATGDVADKPVESIEEVPKAERVGGEQTAVEKTGDADGRAGSVSLQTNEESTAPQSGEVERRRSATSQEVNKSAETSITDGPADEQANVNGPNGNMAGNNPMMMNGMPGQMGYSFTNQANFNNGMGYGMSNMNGMPSMMSSNNWSNMSSMDFNSMNSMNGMSNGMYGNFGGNMGMGMNDMSAMNYGGGYGGWGGMGGGYGNFNNGFSQMSGYNQSGAYPEMMNQFPKNNFSNQNQNRFSANQGAYPQRNMRNGSQGGFGPGSQNPNSRPGSQSGPTPNRDNQSPDGVAKTVSDAKAGEEQSKASVEPTEEGKTDNETISDTANPQSEQGAASAGDVSKVTGNVTNSAGITMNAATGVGGLNPIQTFDSGDADMQDFSQPMMGNGMQYQQGMMNQGFIQPHMDPAMNSNMNMGYNYGPRGGFNNGAYGAAKVLIDQPAEPVGVGVVGAPTGPRAMREGRPNTGFSSRMNSARFIPPAKSVTSTQDAVPTSPQRRVRSRSPQRDESLRVKNKSPSRSRSRSRSVSRGRGEARNGRQDRDLSAELESRREDRERSTTPKEEDDHDRHKERRHHRSSRHDDRMEEYDERHRDDRDSRGNRTRSTSADSKYRSSRREKEKHRSSRSHRDRSREYRRRHQSRSPAEGRYEDDEAFTSAEKESDGSSRRKYRGDKDKYRDRSRDRDRERDRKDRKERDRDYEYERSREKDKDRKRRKDREAEDDERDYDDDKYRSSRRSRKDRDRERSSRHDERDRDERDYKEEKQEKKLAQDKEEDVVGQMMKKRPVSPPLNAPTGPSANGFSIKGRSKNAMPPPVQPPTGPRAFQPPTGPAADRNRERTEPKDHRRKSSLSSTPSGPITPKDTVAQDHYAAERERNARERDCRERVDKTQPTKSLHSRMHSSSRATQSSKRSRDDIETDELEPPRGPKADIKPPSGPASHRDKRRKSGATGDDNIANLFTAGLRKNAKARRGGVRTEGDVEREMERLERERERR